MGLKWYLLLFFFEFELKIFFDLLTNITLDDHVVQFWFGLWNLITVKQTNLYKIISVKLIPKMRRYVLINYNVDLRWFIINYTLFTNLIPPIPYQILLQNQYLNPHNLQIRQVVDSKYLNNLNYTSYFFLHFFISHSNYLSFHIFSLFMKSFISYIMSSINSRLISHCYDIFRRFVL